MTSLNLAKHRLITTMGDERIFLE